MKEKNYSDYNILIAEDNETNFQYLESGLKRNGFNVIRANNGSEAVEIIKSGKKVDVVIMDIMMPVMDGYESTQRIKENAPNIPVIILTAFVSKESVKKSVAKGCDEYLEKPISIKDLMDVVIKWLPD